VTSRSATTPVAPPTCTTIAARSSGAAPLESDAIACAAVAGTYFYIDALNFYYGAVRDTPYKWVDFEALAQALVPHDHIGLIRYFTANVKPRYPGDRAHERQNAYLRAVDTNPLIDIIRGHFRTDVKRRPLAEAKCPVEDLFRPRLRPTWLVRLLLADARRRQTQPATFAHVVDPEEKGSDVNLGTYLLYDALKGACSKAIVITNDSDLAEPIRLTVQEGVPVGIVNPHHASPTTRRLVDAASFEIPFRPSVLGNCQLPNPVTTAKGRQIHKPREW
jgi:hypothetical protein